MKTPHKNTTIKMAYDENINTYYLIIYDLLSTYVITHSFKLLSYNDYVIYELDYIGVPVSETVLKNEIPFRGFTYLENLEKYCFFGTYHSIQTLKPHIAVIREGLGIVVDILRNNYISKRQMNFLETSYKKLADVYTKLDREWYT